uniref:Arginase n=1 Tax=Bionectria ochroleuca TaxID=29856 RepID=A0A8H7TK38_BIOOC
MSPAKSITVISSPYHVGAYAQAVGNGPLALLDGGLIDKIRNQGVNVHEVTLPRVDSFEGEIGKSFELLRLTSKAVTQAVDSESFPIVLAGNCSSAVGVSAGLSAASKKGHGCVWFDAHDDFNTPDALSSGYFDSMPVAMLADLCWKTLLKSVPGFTPMDLAKNFVHCGMRDVTELERSRVMEAGFKVIWGDAEKKVDFQSELRSVMVEKRFASSMIHLDLDSLDVSVGRVNKFSAPGGLLEEDLVGCLTDIPSRTQPLSLTVASYDPSFDNEGSITPVAIRSVVSFLKAMIQAGYIATSK